MARRRFLAVLALSFAATLAASAQHHHHAAALAPLAVTHPPSKWYTWRPIYGILIDIFGVVPGIVARRRGMWNWKSYFWGGLASAIIFFPITIWLLYKVLRSSRTDATYGYGASTPAETAKAEFVQQQP